MPHPFSRIIPDAEIYIDPAILDNKPDMAALVVKIFATWASIERELNFLLVRVLGLSPSSKPQAALAMFEVLTAQHLQLKVLDAAARAELSKAHQMGSIASTFMDSYDVFSAVLKVAGSAQTPRNRLAHWVWGGCRQRQDLLALIDPEKLWGNDYRELDFFTNLPMDTPPGWSPDWIDPDYALAYSISDLDRSLRDLDEAHSCLRILASYLSYEGTDEQREIFEKLNEQRSFRSALNQILEDQKKFPPKIGGPPPLDQNGES
jgi:hypothetical protein